MAKQIKAPFTPQLSKNIFDVSAFDAEFTGEEAVVTMLDKTTLDQINQSKGKFADF